MRGGVTRTTSWALPLATSAFGAVGLPGTLCNSDLLAENAYEIPSDMVASRVMWYLVLMFGITAAQDPVRIGIAAFLVAGSRPMHNLFAYWLGLMITGFGFALAALFLLHDFAHSIQRIVSSIYASPIVPPVQILIGVLALSAAAVLAMRSVRQPIPAPVPGGDSSVLVLEPEPATPPNLFSRLVARLSWTSRLEGKSVGMAFVAGLGTSTGAVEFSAAMVIIAASGAAASVQIGAALMFTLEAFAIVELPLICHLVWPSKTQVIVLQFHSWLRAHSRPIAVFSLSVFGVYLLTKGVGRL